MFNKLVFLYFFGYYYRLWSESGDIVGFRGCIRGCDESRIRNSVRRGVIWGGNGYSDRYYVEEFGVDRKCINVRF